MTLTEADLSPAAAILEQRWLVVQGMQSEQRRSVPRGHRDMQLEFLRALVHRLPVRDAVRSEVQLEPVAAALAEEQPRVGQAADMGIARSVQLPGHVAGQPVTQAPVTWLGLVAVLPQVGPAVTVIAQSEPHLDHAAADLRTRRAPVERVALPTAVAPGLQLLIEVAQVRLTRRPDRVPAVIHAPRQGGIPVPLDTTLAVEAAVLAEATAAADVAAAGATAAVAATVAAAVDVVGDRLHTGSNTTNRK